MLTDTIINRNWKDVNDIKLTPEELEAAIFEGKKKKYFYLRSQQYYIDLEKSCNESNVRQTKLSLQS